MEDSKNSVVKDRSQLLLYFPELVWLLILDKLKNSDDLIRASNSSLFFWNLLSIDRAVFLFPLVWPILAVKYENNTDPAYKEDKRSPKLLEARAKAGVTQPVRMFSVILKLRQVCRHWCQSIDTIYYDLDNGFRLQCDWLGENKKCKWKLCYNLSHFNGCWLNKYGFSNAYKLSKFVNHFAKSHKGSRSPFLTKHISFRTESCPNYSSHLQEFLENFGKYILYCGLHIVAFLQTSSACYLQLQRCLEMMPNLISLRVSYSARNSINDLPQLNQFIEMYPVPRLKNLVLLGTNGLPSAIFNELLSKNSKIQILHGAYNQPGNHLFSMSLENLSQISLNITSESEYQNLESATWKLKKVYLDFSRGIYIPWSQIFKLVEEKWADTATDVLLLLPRSITTKDIQRHIQEHDSLKLYLPKIQSLKLSLGNMSSLEFVLPMKDLLKSLDIFLLYRNSIHVNQWQVNGFAENVTKKSTIKFEGIEGHNVTNIWHILAKLEKIVFNKGNINDGGRKFITRDQWMKHGCKMLVPEPIDFSIQATVEAYCESE